MVPGGDESFALGAKNMPPKLSRTRGHMTVLENGKGRSHTLPGRPPTS